MIHEPPKTPFVVQKSAWAGLSGIFSGIILANAQEQFEKLGTNMRVPDGTNMLNKTRMQSVH